jgi:dihydrofolate synthase/folylpolyglutamate synthase
MTYREVTRYLESFINYEKLAAYPYKQSLKLERIKGFLATINNPQDYLRCIHIAGTKGKGSTSAFVAYILRQAGFKVGLYTSPHLSDFRERIRILRPSSIACPERSRRVPRPSSNNVFEGMIAKRELAKLIERLRPAIERFNRVSLYGPLSFFEVYTALAFVYFKEKKADFVVLETGLGGRLDATNVVNPLVCAITPISYEHTQKLGHTLAQIAREKAGIIKHRPCLAGSPHGEAVGRQASSLACPESSRRAPRPPLIVISAPQERQAREIIRKKCKEVGARIFEVGKEIIYKENSDRFSVKGISGQYLRLRISLRGAHQIVNACTAIGLVESLRFHDIKIDKNAIGGGLFKTSWPGRCEIVTKNPLIILDGAQNVASSKALKQTIKEKFKYRRLILVLGISKDKDIPGVCRELSDIADKVILTKANNPRASQPRTLNPYFALDDIHICGCVKEALAKALTLTGKKDLILVTGSLFVVGEARDILKRSK